MTKLVNSLFGSKPEEALAISDRIIAVMRRTKTATEKAHITLESASTADVEPSAAAAGAAVLQYYKAHAAQAQSWIDAQEAIKAVLMNKDPAAEDMLHRRRVAKLLPRPLNGRHSITPHS